MRASFEVYWKNDFLGSLGQYRETSRRRMRTDRSMTPADPVPKRKNMEELSLLAKRKSRAPAIV